MSNIELRHILNRINLDMKDFRMIQQIAFFDRKNPRKCFKCKESISFLGYIKINLNRIENNVKYLIDIWINPIIELYCCKCYHYLIMDYNKKY